MDNTVVHAARQALGPVGACLPASFTSALDAGLQREAIGRLEHAGYRGVWANEVIGKDAFVQIAMLLAATERIVFGTCIANIWARSVQTMHAAAAQLAQAYPGRTWQASGSGTRRRLPVPARNSALRWPLCVTTWTGWTAPPGRRHRTRLIPGSLPQTVRKWLRWLVK